MFLGCDESGKFRRRYEGLHAREFLRALQYEAEIGLIFKQRANRSPTETEYEVILPLLLRAAESAADFGESVKAFAAEISSSLPEFPYALPLAHELLWNSTVVLRAHQHQPALSWGFHLWTEALGRSCPHLIDDMMGGGIPSGTTRRTSSLLASLASPAPAGGNVVLFHHGLIGIHEICRELCANYRLGVQWAESSVSKDKIVQWETARFATLAARYTDYELSESWVQAFGSYPEDEPKFTESDGEAMHASADVCLSFVILHEYGHIELGHTETIRDAEDLPPKATLHQFEFEADAFALRLLERTQTFQAADFGAICQFLSFFSRAKHLANDRAESNSHPSFEDRILNLLTNAKKLDDSLRRQFILNVKNSKALPNLPIPPLITK